MVPYYRTSKYYENEYGTPECTQKFRIADIRTGTLYRYKRTIVFRTGAGTYFVAAHLVKAALPRLETTC